MITVYGDINFSGGTLDVSADITDLRASGPWNDAISSVKVPSGSTVTLYQDIDFGGASLVLTADAPDLRAFAGPGTDGTWNDVASSIKVSAAGGQVRLTRGGQYVEAHGAAIALTTTPTDAGLVALTKHDDDTFDARFTQANVQLSIQNDGSLQTRSAGTFGPYEQQQVRATTQPDGTSLLYRADGTRVFGEPLIIEAAQ